MKKVTIIDKMRKNTDECECLKEGVQKRELQLINRNEIKRNYENE